MSTVLSLSALAFCLFTLASNPLIALRFWSYFWPANSSQLDPVELLLPVLLHHLSIGLDPFIVSTFMKEISCWERSSDLVAYPLTLKIGTKGITLIIKTAFIRESEDGFDPNPDPSHECKIPGRTTAYEKLEEGQLSEVQSPPSRSLLVDPLP